MKVQARVQGGSLDLTEGFGWAVVSTTTEEDCPLPLAVFKEADPAKAWAMQQENHLDLSVVRCCSRTALWMSSTTPDSKLMRAGIFAEARRG